MILRQQQFENLFVFIFDADEAAVYYRKYLCILLCRTVYSCNYVPTTPQMHDCTTSWNISDRKNIMSSSVLDTFWLKNELRVSHCNAVLEF